jgi:hypothetical protein
MNQQPKSLSQHLFVLTLPIIICLTLVILACSKSAEVQKNLTDNRRKWESTDIKNYKYTFRRDCECTQDYRGPFIISVHNGAIDEVKFADSGELVDKLNYERYPTVEGLFRYVQAAIDKSAAKIKVEYDSELGYPISAYIDYSEQMADEELVFKAERIVADKL